MKILYPKKVEITPIITKPSEKNLAIAHEMIVKNLLENQLLDKSNDSPTEEAPLA